MAIKFKKGGKPLKRRKPSAKVSSVKHANKRFSKLQKRGKIKKSKLSRNEKTGFLQPSAKQTDNQDGEAENDDCDPTDMVEDEDAQYLEQSYGKISFLKSSLQDRSRNGLSKKGEKRKQADDDEEATYESQPRKNARVDKQLKALLPIKRKEGIVPQFLEIADENHETDDSAQEDSVEGDAVEEERFVQPVSTVQLYAKRNKKLGQRKERIALLATRILENPQENMKSLKELRLMMDDKDRDIFLTIRKLVAVSLLEVFKDILPSYRIRVMTEKEKEQRMKKDTKQLHNFEETLLRHYKAFLQRLEVFLKGMRGTKKAKNSHPISEPTALSLGELSIKCLCDLLVAHPQFNYRNNILNLVVPFMAHKNDKISSKVCETMKMVYKNDKIGDVSLDAVKETAKLVKEKNADVQPKVLDTFLSLRIKDIPARSEKKKKFLTKKEKMAKLSRRERKRSKHMELLEQELQEAEVEDSKREQSRIHTQIISQVFLTYFRILKKSTKTAALSSVLEGLAKFAHLINVEFFDDLIGALHYLMESGDLSYRESLHCVQTVFTILSGQGSMLNIDPLRFYTYLYRSLFQLQSGADNDDVPILLTCLDLMFTKRRKQVTVRRIMAFIKRLCSLCLQIPHDGVVAILMIVRSLLSFNKSADILLDTDTSQGSGVYLPELDEPEHCNPNATALWELHSMRRHYHPVVCKVASHLLDGCPLQGEGQLPIDLSHKSPLELWEQFRLSRMEFDPAPPPGKSTKGGSKKRKVTPFAAEFLSPTLAKLAQSSFDGVKFPMGN